MKPNLRVQSSRARIVAWNIATLACLLLILGVGVHFLVRSIMLASVDRDLDRRTERFAHPPRDRMGPDRGPGGPGLFLPLPLVLGPDGRNGGGPPPERGGDRPGPPPKDPYEPRFFSPDGTPRFPDPIQKPFHMASLRRSAAGRTLYATVTVDGEPMRLISRPSTEKGKVTAVVQAAYPLSDVHRALAGLDTALLLIVPICLLFAGLGGLLLTDRVLRPVRYLTQTAEQIGAEDLSLRLEAHGRDEFALLARTLNDMLGRLDRAFKEQARQIEKQRRFTADASHELRTPLTVIKANTSLCVSGHPTEEEYKQSIEDIDRAAGAMSHLVQDLLLLARSDDGQLARDPVPTPIKEIVEHAAARTGAGSNGLIQGVDTVPDAYVMGNPDELVRLFSNLLDNALRHTPEDGRITISARVEDGVVRVCVADTGGGIAAEHLQHLGERFFRVDSARARVDGGTGLGLSICKSIAAAHGGDIAFESEVGKGTSVTVTLPITDDLREE